MSTSESESDFLDLSAVLTGFERVELEGTGLGSLYFQTVRRVIGGKIFGRLLLTWREIASHPKVESQISSRLLADSMLGPISRNIITMWYTGNWDQLPLEWRNRWGATAHDLTQVISAEAYQEGLMWRAIDAHPPTAKSPGFGSWSFPVDGAEPLDDADHEYVKAQELVRSATSQVQAEPKSSSGLRRPGRRSS